MEKVKISELPLTERTNGLLVLVTDTADVTSRAFRLHEATPQAAGLIASADKAKLDALPTAAAIEQRFREIEAGTGGGGSWGIPIIDGDGGTGGGGDVAGIPIE